MKIITARLELHRKPQGRRLGAGGYFKFCAYITQHLHIDKQPEDLRRLLEPNDNIILSHGSRDYCTVLEHGYNSSANTRRLISTVHVETSDVEPHHSDIIESVAKVT